MADFTKVTGNNSHFNGTAFSGATLVGGDTITYEVGTHSGKQYFNDYHGSAGNPIVINLNNRVIDGGGSNIVLDLSGCSYIKVIDGTLHNSISQIINSSSSWGIEIDNVEVYNGVGTGIRVGYQSSSGDLTKIRGLFSDPYAIVKNCYSHDLTTGGEGIYAGASNTDRWTLTGSTWWQYSLLNHCEISNNRTDNTWLDGIQVGSCLDANVFDNVVTDYAVGDDLDDKNGIQMGTGTRGVCYNNFVKGSQATTGGAMYHIQGDGVLVYNNIGIDGFNGVNVQSAYTTANRTTEVYNNTFVDIKNDGAYINCKQLRSVKIHNNIFHHAIEPDGAIREYVAEVFTPSLYVESNNLHTYEALDSKVSLFTDTSTDDFTLIGGSSALGSGLNLRYNPKLISKFENTYMSITGVSRPITGAWDKGAF